MLFSILVKELERYKALTRCSHGLASVTNDSTAFDCEHVAKRMLRIL